MVAEDWLEEDILTLGMRADDARRSVGNTNVFYERVHPLAQDQLHASSAIPDAAAEVRIVGRAAGVDEAVSLTKAARALAGRRRLRAFSAVDLLEWGPLDSVAKMLADAGLDDVAELPADVVPNLADFVRATRGGGLRAERVTIAKPLANRTHQVFEHIYECHKNVGGITRVAPLPTQVAVDKPTTGYEDVRTIAIARLTFNEFYQAAPVFIEVDWLLYGPKLAQVALMFGADFLDNVPATSDDSLGPRRTTLADVERNIRAAGFEPKEFAVR